MNEDLRVACLGAGYFSQFHLNAWARIAGVTVVGVCDNDANRAGATGLPAFADVGTMLAQAQPDILDIIVPSSGHAAAIRAGIEAGVRAIICQKPFCTSPGEAADVAALADAASIPLIVHENFRFQPWYRAIASQIAQGAVGQVLQASFRLRPGDGQGADAYLERQPYFQTMPRFLVHETAVHWVDTFRFLFGNPKAVYADLRKVNPVIAGEDAGLILFDHPGDVRVIFDGNRNLDHAAENTRCTMGEGLFEGTEGQLRLQGDGSVWLRSFGEMSEACVHAADTSGTFGGDCTYHLQAHVVDTLRRGGEFENLAEDYLTVIAIEDAIYRSSEAGQKINL